MQFIVQWRSQLLQGLDRLQCCCLSDVAAGRELYKKHEMQSFLQVPFQDRLRKIPGQGTTPTSMHTAGSKQEMFKDIDICV